MGSVGDELSLEFRPPCFVGKTIGDFLREVSLTGNVTERLSKVEGFVKRLEDEMRKIDAFKRELPLCMFLLNDAIQVLKDEAMQCGKADVKPVLEEFIPLKTECDEKMGEELNNHGKEKDSTRDKKNWMSSVQLWNTDDNHPCTTSDRNQGSEIDSKRNETRNGTRNEDRSRDRNDGRVFAPYKAYPGFSVVAVKEDKEDLAGHGLSLLTPGIKNSKEESASSGSRSTCGKPVSFSAANIQSNMRNLLRQPTSRKQRRCWSVELHRRFVNALQELGGPQVATPKQIRELMQVDGLTNDEVKSHLQKYRLHTRRVPAAKSVPTNESGVVLGDLCMSEEQYGHSSKANSSQSGSPQGPLHLAEHGADDEECDDDDDTTSESYSWKGHSHNKLGKNDLEFINHQFCRYKIYMERS